MLRSGRVNQWTGPDVFDFERACVARFGGGRAIALANGSVALELALRAFGIGPGDEVIVSPRSFVASASCARLVGATPVFADVDPDSGNITPHRSHACLPSAPAQSSRCTSPDGRPTFPESWSSSAAGLKVIEDCAQAHGAEIGGESVGSFGDAAAFSFCQDKIISTGGEGGLLTMKDESAWAWAWSFKDHGKDFAKSTAPAETRHVPLAARPRRNQLASDRSSGGDRSQATAEAGRLAGRSRPKCRNLGRGTRSSSRHWCSGARGQFAATCFLQALFLCRSRQ